MPIITFIIALLLISLIISRKYDKLFNINITVPGRLDGRGVGVRVPVWSITFSFPRSPHRLLGPSSLLSKGYRR
jgi:hypothetical protein